MHRLLIRFGVIAVRFVACIDRELKTDSDRMVLFDAMTIRVRPIEMQKCALKAARPGIDGVWGGAAPGWTAGKSGCRGGGDLP